MIGIGRILRFSLVLVALPAISVAGNLEHRHQIELRIGAWIRSNGTEVEVGPGAVNLSTDNHGAAGAIGYGYWVSEGLAVTIEGGGTAISVNTHTGLGDVSTETASIGFVLLGVKTSIPKSSFVTPVRPFLKVAAGPYIGHQETTSVDLTVVAESRSNTAFGVLLGGGTDFVLSRHLLAGVSLGYNAITDFGQPIGGSTNYSGPVFTIGLSYLCGHDK